MANALLDFSPLNRSIQNFQGGHDLNQQRIKDDQSNEIKKFGAMAQSVNNLAEGSPERAQAWAQVKSQFPNPDDWAANNLDDPISGPRQMMAESGIVDNPLARQLNQSTLDLRQAQIAKLNTPDPMRGEQVRFAQLRNQGLERENAQDIESQSAAGEFIDTLDATPEQKRFLQTNPQALSAFTKNRADTTRGFNQKYQSVIERGFSPDIARRFASGQIKLKRDPVSGQFNAVDTITGEILSLANPQGGQQGGQQGIGQLLRRVTDNQQPGFSPQPQQQAQPNPNPQFAQRRESTLNGLPEGSKTLFEQAGHATGFVNMADEFVGNIAEQFTGPEGFGAVEPETREAKTDFALSVNDLIRTLSVNKRFPVSEIKRIKGLMEPGAMVPKSKLRSQIIQLDRMLRGNLARESRVLSNPNMPVEARREAMAAIPAIEQFLLKLGVKPGADAGAQDKVGGPPGRARNFLKSNPTPLMKQQFDEKYGQGAADSVLLGDN